MYQLEMTEEVRAMIKKIALSSTTIQSKVENLPVNPLKGAKETNNEVLGKYYINTGNRHCLCFEIDEKTKTVKIKGVMMQSVLHKLLNN